MITMEIAVLVLLAYVIGSIPTGLIIGKLFFHTDVRQYGSKNIGATNTYRVLGMKAALPVFLGAVSYKQLLAHQTINSNAYQVISF